MGLPEALDDFFPSVVIKYCISPLFPVLLLLSDKMLTTKSNAQYTSTLKILITFII